MTDRRLYIISRVGVAALCICQRTYLFVGVEEHMSTPSTGQRGGLKVAFRGNLEGY